jgi:hypothetical protein
MQSNTPTGFPKLPLHGSILSYVVNRHLTAPRPILNKKVVTKKIDNLKPSYPEPKKSTDEIKLQPLKNTTRSHAPVKRIPISFRPQDIQPVNKSLPKQSVKGNTTIKEVKKEPVKKQTRAIRFERRLDSTLQRPKEKKIRESNEAKNKRPFSLLSRSNPNSSKFGIKSFKKDSMSLISDLQDFKSSSKIFTTDGIETIRVINDSISDSVFTPDSFKFIHPVDNRNDSAKVAEVRTDENVTESKNNDSNSESKTSLESITNKPKMSIDSFDDGLKEDSETILNPDRKPKYSFSTLNIPQKDSITNKAIIAPEKKESEVSQENIEPQFSKENVESVILPENKEPVVLQEILEPVISQEDIEPENQLELEESNSSEKDTFEDVTMGVEREEDERKVSDSILSHGRTSFISEDTLPFDNENQMQIQENEIPKFVIKAEEVEAKIEEDSPSRQFDDNFLAPSKKRYSSIKRRRSISSANDIKLIGLSQTETLTQISKISNTDSSVQGDDREAINIDDGRKAEELRNNENNENNEEIHVEEMEEKVEVEVIKEENGPASFLKDDSKDEISNHEDNDLMETQDLDKTNDQNHVIEKSYENEYLVNMQEKELPNEEISELQENETNKKNEDTKIEDENSIEDKSIENKIENDSNANPNNHLEDNNQIISTDIEQSHDENGFNENDDFNEDYEKRETPIVFQRRSERNTNNEEINNSKMLTDETSLPDTPKIENETNGGTQEKDEKMEIEEIDLNSPNEKFNEVENLNRENPSEITLVPGDPLSPEIPIHINENFNLNPVDESIEGNRDIQSSLGNTVGLDDTNGTPEDKLIKAHSDNLVETTKLMGVFQANDRSKSFAAFTHNAPGEDNLKQSKDVELVDVKAYKAGESQSFSSLSADSEKESDVAEEKNTHENLLISTQGGNQITCTDSSMTISNNSLKEVIDDAMKTENKIITTRNSLNDNKMNMEVNRAIDNYESDETATLHSLKLTERFQENSIISTVSGIEMESNAEVKLVDFYEFVKSSVEVKNKSSTEIPDESILTSEIVDIIEIEKSKEDLKETKEIVEVSNSYLNAETNRDANTDINDINLVTKGEGEEHTFIPVMTIKKNEDFDITSATEDREINLDNHTETIPVDFKKFDNELYASDDELSKTFENKQDDNRISEAQDDDMINKTVENENDRLFNGEFTKVESSSDKDLENTTTLKDSPSDIAAADNSLSNRVNENKTNFNEVDNLSKLMSDGNTKSTETDFERKKATNFVESSEEIFVDPITRDGIKKANEEADSMSARSMIKSISSNEIDDVKKVIYDLNEPLRKEISSLREKMQQILKITKPIERTDKLNDKKSDEIRLQEIQKQNKPSLSEVKTKANSERLPNNVKLQNLTRKRTLVKETVNKISIVEKEKSTTEYSKSLIMSQQKDSFELKLTNSSESSDSMLSMLTDLVKPPKDINSLLNETTFNEREIPDDRNLQRNALNRNKYLPDLNSAGSSAASLISQPLNCETSLGSSLSDSQFDKKLNNLNINQGYNSIYTMFRDRFTKILDQYE